MLFALSKTVGYLVLPSNFLICLGLLGAILLITRYAGLGRKLLVLALVGLAICAYSPLANFVLYPLEQRFPKWDSTRGDPDGIIVLGGALDADLSAAHGVPVISGAADRIIGAVTLAHRYPNARLIYSGGSPNLISNDAKEADYATALFQGLGIPKTRLVMERQSRNTRENAEFSRQLAMPKPGERWLLVTSAYHMPRSIGLFRKAGFPVQAYPVDWRVGTREDLFKYYVVANDGLQLIDIGVREWFGLIAYRISGATDVLFPGPDN
ncbi:YdcF family protein [Bradyrhizobium lablabi]|uniref:YdcF family protein n=1 Tax=Bradyrhizobium lablabi TaxID=722472 RepID=UPI001BA9EAEA|nr:YdcF family protein [Bradyrhizobium lablabi]MBR1120590.1 YdcF family protein [Bradyrhizobium lablabi]